MSGEYVETLKRRAVKLLQVARSIEDTGLALFLAEQSAQLYIKAVHYELLGEKVRGHGLRELLGLFARSLREAGYEKEADAITGLALEHRRALALLEEAYTMGRYGTYVYGSEDVEIAVRTVEKLVETLEKVAKSVKLG